MASVFIFSTTFSVFRSQSLIWLCCDSYRCRLGRVCITFFNSQIIYMKKIMMLMIAALTISSVSVFAQEKAGKNDTTKHTVLYTCSMHPDVKMDKAGKCPKCG